MRHRILAVGLAAAVALTASPAAALAKPASPAKGNGAQHKVVKDKLATHKARAHQRITREIAKLPEDAIFHAATPRMRAAVDAAATLKQLRNADRANARHLAQLKSAGARNTALQQDAALLHEDAAALIAGAQAAVDETDGQPDVVAAAEAALAVADAVAAAVDEALTLLPTLDTGVLERVELLFDTLRADLTAAGEELQAALEAALAPPVEEPTEEPGEELADQPGDELG
jgi:hypothetical protein